MYLINCHEDKNISRQSVGGAASFFLLFSKMRKERDKLRNGPLKTIEANNWCFLIFSAFPSHNSAKIKKWLLNKDLTLGTALKIWSKDTAKGVTVKYVYFFKISEN